MLAWPTRAYYQSSMSILFIISSFTSSVLYGYVLSQLLSLLTRSCVIKYNTGTYQPRWCLAEWCRGILMLTQSSNWLALWLVSDTVILDGCLLHQDYSMTETHNMWGLHPNTFVINLDMVHWFDDNMHPLNLGMHHRPWPGQTIHFAKNN